MAFKREHCMAYTVPQATHTTTGALPLMHLMSLHIGMQVPAVLSTLPYMWVVIEASLEVFPPYG